MGSAIAWRLFMANMRKIFMMEIPDPIAVRREVSFSEAVYGPQKMVEGVKAILAKDIAGIKGAWDNGKIAVVVDPEWLTLKKIPPDVVVDAILAKKNLGTQIKEAELVIGLGPGFSAGHDVHLVVETSRGHNLGKIIPSGPAQPNTGIPGSIRGFTEERVLRAPVSGKFCQQKNIGDQVNKDDVVGFVSGMEVRSRIDGVVRGLIRSNNQVPKGLKIGDIDPRGDAGYCYTISDKARTISGSVLDAILRVFNT